MRQLDGAVTLALERAGIAASADRRPDARHGSLLAGLVGRGIQESRTPSMHEAEGARLGLHYAYRLLDFDRMRLVDRALPDLILAAERFGFAGLNVTHPFKESVTGCLPALSPDAAAIGAVNTVVFRDRRRVGHNTDCWGFTESFRRGMDGAPLDRVVLIGAGGAGMAVAHALLSLGVSSLVIFDSNPAKAAGLVRGLASGPDAGCVRAVSDLEKEVLAADGLVNATPVGMAKYPGMPVAGDWLRRSLWVADIVYFPAETALLRAARELGCRTLAGSGMAIFQAVKAFELIAGIAPDADEMARHFDSA